MPFHDFHPVVSRWFESRFEAPTAAQTAGWEHIRSGRNTLIAAPTGSGKTLAAFLIALDDLLREGLEMRGEVCPEHGPAPDGSRNGSGGMLPDEVRVIYVSPLKALSADIHRNLAEPRREIRQLAREMGYPSVDIRAAVRSGDTPQSERAAMLRRPPHILVTTPESLYLLLTADRSRAMLRTVRTVIVDEIHAVIDSRRGSHLALSLERLEHVTTRRLQRIGLSATQKPLVEVGRYLVGTRGVDDEGAPECGIVDQGHVRALELALEVPDSPLEAVMSTERWEGVYDQVAALARSHRTTLVFVNTRRLAERVTRHLATRLGEERVATHHGSLSKERRLDAEARLKEGRLGVLVATASMELGIDIGHVDLVVQLGTPRRIATLLQRVGRSGHTVTGTPRGRLFPLSRDELVECAALLREVRRGELDRLVMQDKPLDVLAQQITAEAAAEDWDEGDLLELVRRAWPYRALDEVEYEEVLGMLSRGFSTRRGRRGALLHRDRVNRRLRGRRGARLTAITSGGAIPENADYRVVVEPPGTFVGTVNEDFAVESMAGDVFQLGNASWRVLRVERGVMRVADALGEPPNIPFWLGEAPARSDELSAGVSRLRRDVGEWVSVEDGSPEAAAGRVVEETGLPLEAAEQLVSYLAETRRLLGVVPTQDALVLERFFDDSGGMQLILHAPFGARVNRAWGLALRKRFCRTFNFELQAAATDEGVLLSLGPQHSFPLEEVFRYLHPQKVRNVLVQAVLDSPLFHVRWRWAANVALAVPRARGGGRVPPPLQRMQAEDLLAAVFPDAAACLENIGGDRDVPEHPLVRQALRDCLEEAMDYEGLRRILERVFAGEVELVARDTPEPSPLASQLLNARVFEFLDDAPLEERRARAVYTRRATEPTSADDLGALDASAIERVREEARPTAENPDELHDALMLSGFLTDDEMRRGWEKHWDVLAEEGRVRRLAGPEGDPVRVAVERVGEVVALLAGATEAVTELPADPEEALRELLRGRLEILGPVTVEELAAPLGLRPVSVHGALAALEGEGAVLRGFFTPDRGEEEWCDRRLLIRIHRHTLNRLRAEIEPVSTADLMRFLFRWQRVEAGHRVVGPEGLMKVLEQLDGCELPAVAWELDVLPSRCEGYGPELLDQLSATGRIGWGRIWPGHDPGAPSALTRSSPVSLFLRRTSALWLEMVGDNGAELSTPARAVVEVLEEKGASFFHDLVAESGLLRTQVEEALGELAAVGLVSSDGISGLRALLTPSDRRKPLDGQRRRRTTSPYGVDTAGRWALLATAGPPNPSDAAIEAFVRALLLRYGVVFRRLVHREAGSPPWRVVTRVLRRLEARGEIRGGRFVAGVSGEQFALPEAVSLLRTVRAEGRDGSLVSVSGADPLNLTGIITPGERVPSVTGNRVVYRDGIPVAARVAGEIHSFDRGGKIADRKNERLDQALRDALLRPAAPRTLKTLERGLKL